MPCGLLAGFVPGAVWRRVIAPIVYVQMYELMNPCDALPSSTQSSSCVWPSTMHAPVPFVGERTTNDAASAGGVTVRVPLIAEPE